MVGERIKQIRKILELTQEELSSVMGISKSALCLIETGRSALSKRNRNVLLTQMHVNPCWLDQGRGEMFCSQISFDKETKSISATLPPSSIPLFSVEKSGGIKSFFMDKERISISHVTLPDMPKCDGAIYAPDDSMHPLIQNKDIILFRDLEDTDNIIFGETYIIYLRISKEDHLLVRCLREDDQNDGFFIISSFNPKYPDQKISKGMVLALARVMGQIHINSSI